MKKKLAILRYMFIFSPNETWQTVYQFEDSLAEVFAMLGYEAELVETSGTNDRVFLMSKLRDITEPKPLKLPPPPKNKTQQVAKGVLDAHLKGLK